MALDTSQYRDRVRAILESSDLTTTTSKKVRLQIESEFGVSLESQRKEFDRIVLSVMEELEEENTEDENLGGDDAHNDDHSDDDDDGDNNGSDDDDDDDDDEGGRNRRTETKARRSGTSKKESKKAAGKKRKPESDDEPSPRSSKSSRQSKRSSSSKAGSKDKDGSKPKKETAFTKPLLCSPVLANFMGTPAAARTDVVRKIWEHVRAHNLQDSSDRRFINCDQVLENVLGVKRVHMFTMNKILAAHLKAGGDLAVSAKAEASSASPARIEILTETDIKSIQSAVKS
ncbi:uncharacterized protein BJ171DRAFT_507293 [Polychytrium aggregatum]|uniref:uncharacterized protein n=1 Tax=Polychytrium aggregatum TaxID=110093 RepID=UPI0022FDF07C|nr:uncharacterized protein BJ171DRAFT_507293 [Polychytrium aggregatum]KAI9203993.1 hypothetical protein BJ171DRAFT_507293 [Polychytrium aggregatum]